MNRWSAVLFAAFGLKGLYRDAEDQKATLAAIRASAAELRAHCPFDSVVSATDEAGSFRRGQ